MPEHEAHQGSFGIEDGAFVVPEAPTPDTRSQLRRQVDTEAEAARQAHEASRGERRGSSETPDSKVYAELGGGRTEKRENRLPESTGPGAEGRARAELDEEDRTRNAAALAAARAQVARHAPVEVTPSHGFQEGGGPDPTLFQGTKAEGRPLPNTPTRPAGSPYREPREVYPGYNEVRRSLDKTQPPA